MPLHPSVSPAFRTVGPLSAMTMTAAAALLIFGPAAIAAPKGGQVVSGSANISSTGTTTNIDQSSTKAIINWQGFSVAPNETVNFNQPNTSSMTLNRVIGNERSVIEGALNANGKVYLVNSAGVLMTGSARINTGGFVASGLNISDADFNNGRLTFSSDGRTGNVINLGAITVTDGAPVVLMGKTVSNQGVITATKGMVALASGDKITLNFNGDSLAAVTVDQGTLDALVENKQAIYADGGTVILTAKAADELLSAQVNNDGLIQARSIGQLTGKIVLLADGGTTRVDGTLDASAPNGGSGGVIETSGDKVSIADTATITTLAANGQSGTWLIDPDGFTIAASGGDLTGAALSARLATNGTVIIQSIDGRGSDGDITVNDAVSWSNDAVLTLTATNDINVNKSITATGANAGLVLNYGGDYVINSPNGAAITLSGANASLAMNGQAYTLIHDMAALHAIDGTGYYALAQDMDASGTTYTSAVIDTLTGTLAGLGHTINHLTINNTSSSNSQIGLIGTLGNSTSGVPAHVRDMAITNASISSTTTASVAILAAAGWWDSTVSNVSVSGTVYAPNGGNVGGLMGTNRGTVTNAHAAVTVTGRSTVGGLIGSNSAVTAHPNGGIVTDSSASGDVIIGMYGSSASSGGGGLIGVNTGRITNSQASGDVTATNSSSIGGLVGSNSGTLTKVSASGDVSVTVNTTAGSTSISYFGGLVGRNSKTATNPNALTITNAKATGDVTIYNSQNRGVDYAGGLVGSSANSTITNSEATGNVTAVLTGSSTSLYFGGFVGSGSGDVYTNDIARGNVVAFGQVGGFAGGLGGAKVKNCTAYGHARSLGNGPTGSFAGAIGAYGGVSSVISNSTSYGNATGKGDVGGFVGTLSQGSRLSGVSAYGTATSLGGNDNAGALVGRSWDGIVENSRAYGAGPRSLVGYEQGAGTVTDSSHHDLEMGALVTTAGNAQANQTTQETQTRAATVTDLAQPNQGQENPEDNVTYADSPDYSVDVDSVTIDGVRYDINTKDK